MEILEVYSNNHKIKLYTNSVQNPKKIVLYLHGFNGDLWGDGFSKFRKLLAKEDEIFVCSFDSAGHGMSEVDSLNMTLDLVLQEITDVVNYLENKFKHTPLYFYGTSYGGYRAMVAISKYNYKNLKGIVLVNPAIKMLEVLEKTKGFEYKELEYDSKILIKSSLNKYISKKFLDDLYLNNLLKLQFKVDCPIILVIGTKDDLIPRQDLKDFETLTKCKSIYLDDEHCLKKDTSWQKIIDVIKEL